MKSSENGAVTGYKTWWVGGEHMGKGPFRWLVYQGKGGRLLAASESFDLPNINGALLVVEVPLTPWSKGNSPMSKVTRLICCVTLGITLPACGIGGGQATLTPRPSEKPKPVAPSETPLPTDTRVPPTSEPTEDTGPVLLITPYVDESDMAKAMGFSIDSNSPWGFAHTGIDFAPNGDLKAFRAVCSGTVDMVDLWQLETTLNWQVSVRLVCNSRHSVIYAFEPMTSVEADGETQLANILVVEGQSVAQGDLIGLLPYASPECHVDFGFYDGWDRICPEPFFTPEAKASILNLIHVGWPGANMCY